MSEQQSPSTARVALVTGTSSGMGLHTAVELPRRGLTVVATMRDPSRAAALTDAAREAGVELAVRALDVTDHEAARACVDGVITDHGRIDVLVNNAGRGAVATAEQLSIGDVRDQLEVNYLGPVALTKLVLPHMREAGSGTILTVASIAAKRVLPGSAVYTATKMAVIGFSRVLAEEMRPHGVRVGVLVPGAVDTPLWDTLGAGPPREKMLRPEDVARAAVLMATLPPHASLEELTLLPAGGIL